MPMKEFNSKLILLILEAIKEKLAQMATETYVGESATYRAAKDIEDRLK